MNRLALATLFFLPMTAVHPGINITLGDLGLFALVFWRLPSAPRRVGAYFALLLLLAALVSLTTLWRGMVSSLPVEAMDMAQAVFLFAIVLPFGWRLGAQLEVPQVARALSYSGVTQALVAIAQVGVPNLRLPTQPALGVGEFGSRPIGLVGNPNALGLVCSWVLPFAVYLSLRSERRRARWGWAFAAAIIALGGVLGFSKAALVTIPTALVASLLLLHGRRGPLLGLTFGLITVAVWKFGSSLEWFASVIRYRLASSESLGSRLEGYVEAWAKVEEWFFVGVGPGMDWQFGPGDVRLHNPVIGMAVQFGALAAIVFFAAKALLFLTGLARSRTLETRVFLLAFVIAEAALLVHPLYWMRAHYLPLLLLTWWLSRPYTADAPAGATPVTRRFPSHGESDPCAEF